MSSPLQWCWSKPPGAKACASAGNLGGRLVTGQSCGNKGGGGGAFFLFELLPGALNLGLRWTLTALGFRDAAVALTLLAVALAFLVAAILVK